jgi:flagellar biosynthesis protein FlhF
MRLKRIGARQTGAPDDPAATARLDEGDFDLSEIIAPGEAESGGSIAWPTSPGLLIADVLALHGVPAALAERVVIAAAASRDYSAEDGAPSGAPDDPLRDLAAGLADCLSFSSFAGLWRGGALALVGPPGVGKTTMAGKLAARARRGGPILVNTDAARSGVAAQLAEYSGVLGVTLGSAGDAQALARSLAGRRRRVIIDTSGINPFDREAVSDLANLVRSARAEPVLVLPANIEPDEAVEIALAFRMLPIRYLLVTRLDIVRRLGGLLAAASAGGYDIVGGSVTPHFTFGLRPLTPIVLARRLLSAALDDTRWTTA